MTIATVLTPQVLALLLAAAVLIFIIALVVMGFLLHGMKTALTGRVEMLATGQRASAELVDAGLERIKQELLHANATQGNNFANFLQIEQAGRDSQEQRLERLTQTLSGSLQQMNAAMASELARLRTANEQALGEMRATVDEKLQATLNTRITESFKTVEEQLAEVHRRLGEMREMARNVDGLRRVLTNVKTRGVFGETQLALLLEQILTPDQYEVNVATRPGSSERVEFAVKLPGAEEGHPVLLPIDAKFPLEDYQRLVAASEACDAKAQAASLKALQTRILLEAQKIHDKYVEVPYTTEFAVMYLPVESLWSEVLRVPGLVERVQREHHVSIAGPSALAAFLNSLQMGFRTLAIERKSSEVWRLLGEIKSEFGKFSESVAGMEKKVEAIRSALESVRTRTNVMSRRLRSVEIERHASDKAALAPQCSEGGEARPPQAESSGFSL